MPYGSAVEISRNVAEMLRPPRRVPVSQAAREVVDGELRSQGGGAASAGVLVPGEDLGALQLDDHLLASEALEEI